MPEPTTPITAARTEAVRLTGLSKRRVALSGEGLPNLASKPRLFQRDTETIMSSGASVTERNHGFLVGLVSPKADPRSAMSRPWRNAAGIAAIAFATLLHELLLVRWVSARLLNNYAFLIISMAMA